MKSITSFSLFKNNQFTKQTFSFKKYFSTSSSLHHTKIAVIGAGTGGLAVSSQLVNQNILKGHDITIFDPSTSHYYQPGYTKLGGGIINSLKEIEYNTKDLAKDFNFQNVSILSIDPEHNTIETSNHQKFTYEHLIIAAGLDVKLDSIPGLKALMDDKSKFVSTIYDPNYAIKVKWMRENFKGGRALFTQPPPPLKCGGAPQKIAYLCDDYWKTKNIKADVHFFTPLPQMFAIKYYSDSLAEIVKKKNIHPHYTSVLTSVRDGVATFKNTTDGSVFEEQFDFLHAVPLLSTPTFLKNSPVANPSGFVTIEPTMRHKKYSNIWAIGDCVDLPNAKTAAAIFSQAPVLVKNLEMVLTNEKGDLKKYDGYSSCPLYISKGELLLAEFKEYNDEKGNLVRENDESFHPGKQYIPRQLYYWVAVAFTKIYPYGLKGKWFGKTSMFRPTFNTCNGKKWDVRCFYKYINYVPVVLGGAVLVYCLI